MKTIYFVMTDAFNWGKGLELETALNNAKSKGTNVNHITVLIFKEDTPLKAMSALINCYNINYMGTVLRCEDLSTNDIELVAKYYVCQISLPVIKVSFQANRKRAKKPRPGQ